MAGVGMAGPGWIAGTEGPALLVWSVGGPGLGGGASAWRVTASSRSAARASCSARGRDTSRARIAVDNVIFMTGMSPSVAYRRQPG